MSRHPTPVDEATAVERFRAARADPALAVLEGFHPLKHALRFGGRVLEAASADPARVIALAADLAPDLTERLDALVVRVSPAVFRALAPIPPSTGVVALADRPRVDPSVVFQAERDAPVVLLERPARLGNLGAVVRVAAAVGAAGVVAVGENDPWHPDAIRGAAGLQFALPVARMDVLPPPYALADRPLVAIDPGGKPLEPEAIPSGAVLALGSERNGLSAELLERAHLRFAIPMRKGVSSLNLATAAAVALYAWRLGRRASGES